MRQSDCIDTHLCMTYSLLLFFYETDIKAAHPIHPPKDSTLHPFASPYLFGGTKKSLVIL